MTKVKDRIKILCTTATEPMSIQDITSAEALLAKLIARTYAAEHQDLFGPNTIGQEGADDMTDEA